MAAQPPEGRGEARARDAGRWAQVRRGATVLLALGVILFALCILAVVVGSPVLVLLGFLGLGTILLSCLLLIAPVGSLVIEATQRWAALRAYLRVVAGILVGFFLLALAVSIRPDVLLSRILLAKTVLSCFTTAVLVARFGVGAGIRRLRILQVTILLTMVLGAIPDLIPRTYEALRVAFARLDRYVAWTVETDRSLSPRVRRLDLDSLAQVDSTAFFDADGNPLVWFAATGGLYDFFSTPGTHPETREPLQPVTPRVVEEYRGQLLQRAEEASAKREAQELARRRRELSSLFHPLLESTGRDGSIAIAVAVDPSLNVGSTTATQLLADSMAIHARENEHLLASFFAPRFEDGGYLRRALDDGGHLLREMGALEHVDAVLLGVVSGSCGPNPARPQMTTCRVTMRFRSFHRDGQAGGAGTISVTSAGFSRDSSIRRGLELLGERKGARMLSGMERRRPVAARGP